MQMKSILAAAAIALVAGLGSASAGDEFATLDGIQAEVLLAAEMEVVTGKLTKVVPADLSTPADIINGLPFHQVELLVTDIGAGNWQIMIFGFPDLGP